VSDQQPSKAQAGEPELKSMKPLDPPTVPFAVGGMAAWLIAWLVTYLAFRDDHPSWPSICIAGFVLGIPGLAIMIVHDRHRRQRRDQSGEAAPQDAETSSDAATSQDMG
jgi:hypothetical protein